jgi:uncharacterized protein
MDVSPLLKVLTVFAGLLLLTRLRLHLGAALVLGGISLSAWSGRTIAGIGNDLASVLQLPELWLLLLITLLIFEFGRYMAQPRNAEAIMRKARAWGGRHSRALSLMALPAAIGLVPMPGGALFSAPLVDQAATGTSASPAWKSAVNYWFRHVWEYWWPLYPVVIVTLAIFNMDIWRFILLLLPLSAAAWLSGYFILIRPQLASLSAAPAATPATDQPPGNILAPLLIVTGCTLLLPTVFHYAGLNLTGQTRTLLAMLIGLMAGLVPILADSGASGGLDLFRRLRDRKAVSLMGTIAGVIVFKGMLDRSGLLPEAATRFMTSGIPSVFLVALLPFVAGMVTGIAIGFAGIAFPLLVGLAAAPGSGLSPAAILVLGFACGYAGMMCSPVHLCFILSRGFFNVSIRSMLRYVLPCTVGPLITSILLYILLNWLGW